MHRKSIYFSLVFTFFVLNLTAATVQIASGDISAAINAAVTGDIIELTTSGGVYNFNTAVTIANKSITIRGAVGLSALPIVRPSTYLANQLITFSHTSGGTLTIQGIEWDINNKMPGLVLITTTAAKTYTVNIDNCNIHGQTGGSLGTFRYSGETPNTNTLTVTNSVFGLNSTAVYHDGFNDYSHPTSMSFINCYFNGISDAGGTFYAPAGEGLNTYIFNHCTFYGNSNIDLSIVNATGGTASITNSIFAFNTGTANNKFANANINVSNVGIYYTGIGTKATMYPTSGTNTLSANPVIGVNNGIAHGVAYVNAGTDGKTIGYYNNGQTLPPADVTIPTTPVGLVNTPPTTTSFTLSWAAATDNVGVTSYDVYKDGVLYGSTNTTSFAISGLTLNTSYSMTVIARDAVGNSSIASTALIVTTPAINVPDTQAPSVPIFLSNTTPTLTSFTLSWSASTDNVAVASYDVYKDEVFYGNTSALFMTISGLSPATSYSMTVVAKDFVPNYSAPSTALIVTTAPQPVTNLASGDLAAAITAAADGDIINLTGTTYTWNASVWPDKSITVRADAALGNTRPVVTTNLSSAGQLIWYTSTSAKRVLSFTGFEITGGGSFLPAGLTFVRAGDVGDVKVLINKCVFRNFSSTATIFTYSTDTPRRTTPYGDLVVSDTAFFGPYANLNTKSVVETTPQNIYFSNCYFSNVSGATLRVPSSAKTSSSFVSSVNLDHCTFNGCALNEFDIQNDTTNRQIPMTIKNSIFSGNTNTTTANTLGSGATLNGTKCAVYYTAAGKVATLYPTLGGSDALISNPSLNASGFATAAPYLKTALDGRNIGFYDYTVLTPIVYSSITSLNALVYNQGNGTSAQQSFTVSGVDLTANLVITPSSNLEISTNSGANYSSNAIILTPIYNIVGATTIYVRLKAGLSINIYNENIVITSTNAITKNVSCSAQVISTSPTIITSVSSLSGFIGLQGGGATISQQVQVYGYNLTGDINVTPPSDFEVSLSAAIGFTSSSLLIPQISGYVNVPLYVRMKGGLATGTTNQSVTLTSSNAGVVNLGISGSVTAITTSNFNTNAANNIDLRIANKFNVSNEPVYSIRDYANGVFIRNPDCWAADLDMTSLSPWNNTGRSVSEGRWKAGVLITPRHFICATHFNIGVGTKMLFVTKDNITVTRTVIGTGFNSQNYPDEFVGTLDSDVPNSISFCKFLPSNYANYITGNASGLPFMWVDQEESAFVGDISTLDGSANGYAHMFTEKSSTDAKRLSLFKADWFNDSGSPVFIVLNGQLVIISCRTWSDGSGSSYTYFSNQPTGSKLSDQTPGCINDIIKAADVNAGVSTDYKVTYFDFTAPTTTSLKAINPEQVARDVVYSNNHTLYVNSNSNERKLIQVYNLVGSLIVNSVVSNYNSFELPNNGIFIVTVSTKVIKNTYKIIVN